jgi:hypothetical protein
VGGGITLNVQIVSTIIQAGTELLSEFIRNRQPASINQVPDLSSLLEKEVKPEPKPEPQQPPRRRKTNFGPMEEAGPIVVNIQPEQKEIAYQPLSIQNETPKENKAAAIATGCVPCSLGHVGTCSGLLNEATRFARGPKGAADPEVIDRVNMCLDELNSLEREDLRPEKITQLTGWERKLAEDVLMASRQTRHKLEDVSNMTTHGLEEIAGSTQAVRQKIGREWFQNKIANLSPEDQENIKSRVMERLEEMKKDALSGDLEIPDVDGQAPKPAPAPKAEDGNGNKEVNVKILEETLPIRG